MSDVLSRSGVFSPRARRFSTGGPPRKACLTRSVSVCSSLPAKPLLRSSLGSDFQGRKVAGGVEKSVSRKLPKPARVQMALRFPKAVQWWEKDLQPNMEAVHSAQHLVDSLVNAGNKLVIVDFFSPGCGGCRALHPKICQFAETNPDVLFLHINYEENKSMCYSLNVHVLPFVRFYRGAQGRLCSFSCTNATIKKFKDALAKHSTDRCSLGPAKGLEESELMALAANKDLNFAYPTKKSEHAKPEHVAPSPGPVPGVPFLPAAPIIPSHGAGEKAVVGAGR